MSSTDHSKMSLANLNTNFNRLVAKLDDLELEDAEKNKEKITKLNSKIAEYQTAIDAKTKELEIENKPLGATPSIATRAADPLGKPEAKYYFNSMVNHFKTNVPTLEPPLDVSVFIQRLNNCFNLYVEPFPALEPYFVQQAKGYLSMDILETLNASEEKTNTFKELQIYLKKHFGSRETPFQILNSLMELDIKDGEKLQEFAGRLERKVAIVATQITAKFKDQESNTANTPMTATDCFNLFGSMLFYDHLRKRQPNCFNLMVKEVDNCWKPSDLGSMAATLVDRIDYRDPAATNTHSARPFQKQHKATKPKNKHKNAPKYNSDDNDICLRYLFYKSCHFGNKCKRKHLNPGDDEYNEVLQRLNSDSHQAPNETNATHEANVAFNTYPEDPDDSEGDGTELRPELVGMDIFGPGPFGLYGGSKN